MAAQESGGYTNPLNMLKVVDKAEKDRNTSIKENGNYVIDELEFDF